MKIRFLKIFLCSALIVSSATSMAVEYSFNSEKYPMELSDVEVINIREVDSKMLIEIMEGRCPQLALEISKDEQLPLNLFLKGDFVELIGTSSELFVQTKQNLYFRNVEGSLLFSTDSCCWFTFTDFISGTVSVLLGVEKPGKPQVTIGAELYKK